MAARRHQKQPFRVQKGVGRNTDTWNYYKSLIDAQIRIPAPVDETMSSIASRAWSVDSDAIHGPTNSSDKLVTDFSPILPDLTIISDPQASEDNEITMKLLPVAARKSEGIKYESPSIEDVEEDSSPRPVLPADSKFVLEPTRSPGSCLETESSDSDIRSAQSRADNRQVSRPGSYILSSEDDSRPIKYSRRTASSESETYKVNQVNHTRKLIPSLGLRDTVQTWSEEVC